MFYVMQRDLVKKEYPKYGLCREIHVDGEVLGTCTCGEVFPIMRKGDPDWEGDNRHKMEPKMGNLACPRCGDPYGHVWLYSEEDARNGEFTYCQKFEEGCLYDVRLADWDDSRIIFLKEAIINDGAETGKFRRYEVTVAMYPSPHVERLVVDGKEVKLSKTKVSAALTYISLDDHAWAETPLYRSPFYRELRWARSVVDTTSMANVVRALEDYPVLDSIYHNRVRKGDDSTKTRVSDGLRIAFKEGVIESGERSEQKAFGIPKVLCDMFWGKANLKYVQKAYKAFGAELAASAIDANFQVNGKNGVYFRDFVAFYCSLKTAERERLMQYLTHDVAVYQGIERPGEAWQILKDYRKMCQDMDIAPKLCPKSLKLQHDMAKRNYRLCLDEIERKKFVDATAGDNYKKLNWTSSNSDWTVVIPNEPNDMVEEGRRQSHCVASYISDVISGKFRVCFLRKTEEPDKPVLTLTVDEDDCCLYYKGFDNREATEEEKKILAEWAKSRKLTVSEHG
jgi:hypothetical protein